MCYRSHCLRDIHVENGAKIVELSLLGLSGLDVHRAHEGVETLCEGREALLLHVDALEGMVVNALLIVEDLAARAVEAGGASAAHLLPLIDVHRLLHATIAEEGVNVPIVSTSVLAIVEVRVAILAEGIILLLGLLLTRPIVEPA